MSSEIVTDFTAVDSNSLTRRSDSSLRFEQRADGLHLFLPGQPPAKYAYALRVTFQHAAR